jgi:hypothetical protein
MALISKNPTAETTGGIAAKVAYPVIALFVAGVALGVLDGVDLIDIDDGVWMGVIGSALAALGIGIPSPAALQKAKDAG